MATANDVITRALRMIGVLAAGEAASAEDAADALGALNDMLRDWEADGVSLGFAPLSSVGGALGVPDDALRAIKFNLAVELAPEYSTEPSPTVLNTARDTYRQLLGASMLVSEANFDHLPGVVRKYDINGG